MNDEILMKEALAEALLGLKQGEVPIGSVVVDGGRILGRAHNCKESLGDPTAHAELLALRQAAQSAGSWRLNGATLYTTAEPCLMCLGGALQARVSRLVYGCKEPKFGAAAWLAPEGYFRAGNHEFAVEGGVLDRQCADLLREFFAARRAPKALSSARS